MKGISIMAASSSSESGSGREAFTLAAIGCAVFTVTLLLWAIYGTPPYAFFGFLRCALGVTAVLLAFLGFKSTKLFAPLSLALVSIAYVHFTAKMQRVQWVPFNWAAIGILTVSSIVLYIVERRKASDVAMS
jgi:hypothetical protein